MKTIQTRLLLSVVLLLCSAMPSFAKPVSRQQATQQARQFMSVINPQAQIEAASVYKAPRRQAAVSDAAYYVFNAQDNQGFVIVSGDDRTAEILGYSDKGHFDICNLPVNIKSWLDGYEEQIQWLDDNHIEVTQEAKARSKVSASARNPISPLVTSVWDQEAPFNNNCPSLTNYAASSASTTLTGCVATAMAQVMNYNKWPQAATKVVPGYTMSYPYYNNYGSQSNKSMTLNTLPSTTFDWSNMLDDYTGSYTDAEGAAVAQLMQYCGYSVKMTYGTSEVGGSGAQTSSVAKALVDYFGYDASTVKFVNRSNYTMDEWNQLMYDELASGRAVVYGGQSDGGGHSFVCDGYSYDGFFHINWGWSGMSNGYFKLSILNPYASGSGGSSTSNGFSYSQDAVIGIQAGTAPAQNGSYQDTSVLSLSSPLSLSTTTSWNTTTYKIGVMPLNTTTGDVYIYDIAVGVVGENDAMATQLGNSISVRSTLKEGYGYNQAQTFSFTNTALTTNGTYTVKAFYRTSSGGQWIPFEGQRNNYVQIVVSGGKITSASLMPNPANLRVDNVSYDGDHVIGLSQCLRYTITNTSATEDFDGQLYLFANSSSYEMAENGVFIKAGATAEVEMFFTASDLSNATTYTMKLASDASCTNVISNYSLSLSKAGTAQSLSNIELIGATFDGESESGTVNSGENTYNAYNVYGGSRLTATFRATNSNSQAYDAYMLVYLYDNATGNSVNYAERQIHVAKNSTADVSFTFDGLEAGKTYLLQPYYYYSSSAYNSFDMTVFFFLNGLTTWTADGKQTGSRPTEQIVVPEDACAVSLSGLTINSVSPNSNPNTLYFIGESEDVPAGLENCNVVKGSNADEIALIAGYDFYTPTDISASKISYTRTFAKGHGNKNDVTEEDIRGGWSTIVLPFSPTSVTCEGNELTFFPSDEESGNYWLYEFGAEDADSHTVYFAYPTEFKANRPYIIAVPGDKWGAKWNLTGKQIVFSTENAYIYADAMPVTSTGAEYYKFVGNYSDKALSNIYKLNDAGYNFGLTESASVDQFGAYFTTGSLSATSAADKLNIGILGSKGTATSLNQVALSQRAQDNSGRVYDLQGREIKNGQMGKGLYIQNGNKLLINK